MENLYEKFVSMTEHIFLHQQEHKMILEQLRRHICFLKAYFIHDVENISTLCVDYESSVSYTNYSDRTPCVGNWPGFLMTKMPYWEREY